MIRMNKTISHDVSLEAPASILCDDDGFRVIFDSMNDGIFIIDPDSGRFIDVNPAGCCMFGHSKDEIMSLGVGALSSGIPPYTEEMALRSFEAAAAGPTRPFEWHCKKKGGEIFPTEISHRYTKIGQAHIIVAIVRDITERKELRERFQQLVENIIEVFWMTTPDKSMMLYVSPGYEAIWGRSCQSLYENPRQWLDAIHDEDRQRVIEKASRQADGDYHEEYRIVRPDGEVRWISDRAFPVRDDNGKVHQIAGVAIDITKRKRLTDRIEHMAHHDALTELPNRLTFTKALDEAIARARRTGKEFAVLSLDLDNFKDVNDTRGHATGDRLLQLVAGQLLAGLRLNDVVARFGGDEFAILLADPIEPDEIAALASRIIASVSRPHLIDGIVSHVGASIGVVMSEKYGCDAESLMSHADIALYRAKAEGRGTYRFFSKAMNEEVQARVTLTNELRLAIPNGQLFLVYQPQVTAECGRIVGIEALVRWRHPRCGTLAPDQFLPIAERSGLIGPLGEWVLREACRQARQWIDARVFPGTISVNLSSVQFNDPFELGELVVSTLAESGLPPHLLELEINERMFIRLTSQHEAMIQRLRHIGVRFALDDFGIGNALLTYLRRVPIDRIKIPREFIAEITTNPRTASIVKLVLGFAREFGTNVVAEGVETSEQLRLLQDLEFPDIQGFYLAIPMPANSIAPLLSIGTISVLEPDAAATAA